MELSRESQESYAEDTSESVHFPLLERLGFLLKPEKIMTFLEESLWQNLLLISGRPRVFSENPSPPEVTGVPADLQMHE